MGLQLSGLIQLNGSIDATVISSSFFGDFTIRSDSSKDTEFDNSTGFNDNVNTIVIDSNGKIYVGGFFTTYKGVQANRIIRLNPDGSKDTEFDNSTGFNGAVTTIAIDSNGKIYIGGSFSTYKGVSAWNIIRLNPDGSKDTGFDNSTGFNTFVRAIAIDSNGKIYVGGTFSSYKGVEANEIIRLNPDGSKDTEFDNSTGFNNIVYDITIDSNGKIYVGGLFTTYKGVEANRIIRLDTAFIPFISTTELKERLDNPTPAFPFTGSANISGSANINGTIVLSTVSSSFNFADDAAAASGGIDLGGLYHTTGSIKIRLV
jgi:uncharacterized delta-60 repeat protein